MSHDVTSCNKMLRVGTLTSSKPGNRFSASQDPPLLRFFIELNAGAMDGKR